MPTFASLIVVMVSEKIFYRLVIFFLALVFVNVQIFCPNRLRAYILSNFFLWLYQ